MKVDKQMKDRLISISNSIKYVAKSKKEHIPDKISFLETNITLMKFEIEQLKRLRHTSCL